MPTTISPVGGTGTLPWTGVQGKPIEGPLSTDTPVFVPRLLMHSQPLEYANPLAVGTVGPIIQTGTPASICIDVLIV